MDQTLSLVDFYRFHYEPLKLRSRSSNTRRLYEGTIRSFTKFLARAPSLADLTDAQVNRYLSWFRQLPRAAPSVNKERNNLLAIWRFAARKRFVEDWPDVDPEIEPTRVPQAWTADQVARIFKAAEAEPGLIASIPAADWWRALLYVSWDTGERIGAVTGVCWDNVDLTNGWVLCVAETRKGKRADKLYKLADDTVQALRAIRRPFQLVFCWPYNKNYLWTKYGNILKRAGLPCDRKSKFHRLRKTVASYFEAAGGNATELLGHSRRAITNCYLDPRIVKHTQAVDLLFRPIR